MRQHVPPEQLWNEFHGDLEFEYDHSIYWPALLKISQERHAEQFQRWVEAGKHYGESEAYLKGGNVPSIFKPTEEDAETAEEKLVPAPTQASPEDGEVKPILQPEGTQANNTDVTAATTGPVLTTEAEKANK